MDPRRKKHPNHSSDHRLPSTSVNKIYAKKADQKPVPSIKAPTDTHVQVKAMTTSINGGNPSWFKHHSSHQPSHSDKKMEISNGSSSEKRNLKPKTRTERHIKEGRAEEELHRGVVLNRRKSFSDPEIELGSFVKGVGAKIVAMDMPPFMQIHAVGCARKTYDSLEKYSSKNLACTLKKEFDGVYGPAWHCIVGTSFGSFVTHSVGGFLYFSMDKLYILLFKTTVQKAE